MRLSVIAACFSLCLIGFATADEALASIRQETSIPPEGLAPALKTLAKERNFQIVYVTEEIANVHTQGAIGEFTPEEALRRLLTGTGLVFRYLDDKTVTIFPLDSATAVSTGAGQSAGQDTQGNSSAISGAPSPKEGTKSSSGELRLAQANQESTPSALPIGNPSQGHSPVLSEVIVTAQKRSERLQDVPVPVTAINAEALVDSNQVSIEDYYTRIPGLSLTPTGFGGPQITIRGISTGGFANPTVGVVVDDLPYGSSTNIGGLGSIVPDIDPSDLARIEVLRGPQGTLYGASAMGGLLKFVTIDPSTDGVSGHVQAGTSSTYNAANLGYSFRGTVNVPLTDTMAFLASGFTRRDPGYIDNVQTGQEGINRVDVEGGRIAGLWRPSDYFSLKLSAMLQDSNSDGSDDILPSLGDLKQSTLIGTGGYDKKVEVYAATVTAKFWGIDFTSVSGYNINNFHFSADYSSSYGPFADSTFGVTGVPLLEQNKTDKFTQEIRLAAPLTTWVDWLLGGFYTNEQSRLLQQLPAINSSTGTYVGSLLYGNEPSTLSEYAAFADLTFHFTDQFNVQVGGRESEIRQTQSSVATGPLVGGTSVSPELGIKANAFTWLLTPQFKLHPDLMIYARLASGYRAGGPNSDALLSASVPKAFDPDKTENYEIGVKGDTLDHRLTFDASIYYINWRDIQLQVIEGQYLYDVNGGKAKSEGIELSTEARPLEGLIVAGWVAFGDAELTQDLPPASVNAGAYGVAGDRLPGSSRFSGRISLDQQFHLTGAVTGIAGGALSYQGNRLDNFGGMPPPPRTVFPGYATIDLHTGVSYQSWKANLYVNNLADRRASLADGVTPGSFLYIQPRTVGVNITRSF